MSSGKANTHVDKAFNESTCCLLKKPLLLDKLPEGYLHLVPALGPEVHALGLRYGAIHAVTWTYLAYTKSVLPTAQVDPYITAYL